MSDKRLFIHIPKNAGMTIRHGSTGGPLRDRVQIATKETHISREYSDKVNEVMRKSGDHHGWEHARWRDIHPNYRNKMKCFAVTRNPWDRVVSRYFFIKKIIEVERKEKATYSDVSSFETWLEERHVWGNKEYYWHRASRGWYPAFDYVTDEEGNLKCDMMRLEHLNDDLCGYFDIKEMSRARNVTALNKNSYMDVYTPQTIQIVADWYQKDIDFWGYDFDSGAKKNYWALKNES